MSEELTREVPTSVQDSTHTGSISLPDFNFSLHLHVHVTATPALQASLDRIAEAQKPDDFEFKGTIVERPDWIQVPGYRDLRYYEDGEKLFIKYMGSGALETSWKQMVEFSRLPIDECKKARDKLLEALKVTVNKNSVTVVNCFVTAIQKGKVVPPKGVRIHSEKTPAKHGKKQGPKVHWTSIPNHPILRYREENGDLILNYAGSIVTTTWEAVEGAARLDQKYWKYEIEKIVGSRPTANRKAAVSLFLRLVENGEVSRGIILQFRSAEKDTGVNA
jgi:hypothetical protein